MDTIRALRSSLFLVVAVALATGCTATAPAQKFSATGQTTCYDSIGAIIHCAGTGQDGEIRAGAKLRYRENLNGTITDLNTLLVWEKQSDDGTIHDKDNLYTWENAFAVHVATLNTSGFAGKRDWRVPNLKELQSIINYESSEPAVSAAFNTHCVAGVTVLTGSCTGEALHEPQGGDHWSSTSLAGDPSLAWGVGFDDGSVPDDLKSEMFYVRAVRGGTSD